ncbi:MAG: aldehyde dehydrogenase family protein, partial [Gammaproteobacteria bacterium]|nr:aldehyde dehydrogenase family protein [Gammaproteobacteria bacterium]
MADKPLLIPGVTTSAHPLQVRAPYDNQLIATLDTADAAAVEQALATAHALYRDRDRWLSGGERIRILQGTAELMTAEREELARAAAGEGGKPLVDS